MTRGALSSVERDGLYEYLQTKGLPLHAALTFGDVTLAEAYSPVRSRSEIKDFRTHLTDTLSLGVPIVSANMESVTGLALAVAVQREGGLAFPPQTLPLEERLRLIHRIGRSECAFIEEPLTISPHHTLGEAKGKMREFGIHSLIVVGKNRKPVGIMTRRDWFYEGDERKKIRDLMTKKIITAPSHVDFATAAETLREHRIEKLPLVDRKGRLAGLITAHGLFYEYNHPRATRDVKGRFLRAGSIGVGKQFSPRHLREVEAQVKHGMSILLIDTARAFSKNTEEAIRMVKKRFPRLPLVVGNVSTPEGAKFLIECGADVVKVGQGPGFACRTRAVGVGVPQLTAVASCAYIAKRYGKTVIADGGMKSPGDIAKALVAGANAVMLGYLLARTRESAGPIFLDNEERPVKNYIGSASFQAQWQRIKAGTLDHVRRPEGVTQVVPVVGTVKEVIDDVLAGLSSAMAYLGVKNIPELQQKTGFICQTSGGHFEGVKTAKFD